MRAAKAVGAVKDARSVIIVLGGFAGTGKTTMARRLSLDWSIPRLSSDAIGRTITTSHGITDGSIDAYRLAYDMVFALCEEFVQSRISVILDLNMGWAFQWRYLDAIRERHSDVVVMPILLRCAREICLERTRQRHAADPGAYDPPEIYATDPKILRVAAYLDQLNRTDIHVIDASRGQDEVYGDIRRYLETRLRLQLDE